MDGWMDEYIPALLEHKKACQLGMYVSIQRQGGGGLQTSRNFGVSESRLHTDLHN